MWSQPVAAVPMPWLCRNIQPLGLRAAGCRGTREGGLGQHVLCVLALTAVSACVTEHWGLVPSLPHPAVQDFLG